MTDAVVMLDTNIVLDILGNSLGDVACERRQHGRAGVWKSSIVASEIRCSTLKKGPRRLQAVMAANLDQVEALDSNDFASHFDAEVSAGFEIPGTPIGLTELFIAAHAKSLDLTSLTGNVCEFSRVEGLKIENWIKRGDADVE